VSRHITLDGLDLQPLWRHRISAAFQDYGRFQTTAAAAGRLRLRLRQRRGHVAARRRLGPRLDRSYIKGTELCGGRWQKPAQWPWLEPPADGPPYPSIASPPSRSSAERGL